MDQDQEHCERPGRPGMAVAILILHNPFGRLRGDDALKDDGSLPGQGEVKNIFASLDEFLKAMEEQNQIEQFERLNGGCG